MTACVSPLQFCALLLYFLDAEITPSLGDSESDPDDGISCRHIISTLLYCNSCVQKEHLPDELAS
jgi:hypothetical protein